MREDLQLQGKDSRWPHPGYALLLLFFLAPLPFSVRFLSYSHPKEFVIALLVGVSVALTYAHWMRSGRGEWVLWPMALAALIHGKDPRADPSVLAAVILLVVFAGTFCVAADQRWRERLDAAFLAGALAVAALALGQFAGVLNFLFPVNPHYDQRMYSVFGNQDLLGGYMAAAMAVLWARAAWAKTHAQFAGLALAQAVLAVALLLSGCRSAWAACAAGLVLAYWARPQARVIQRRLALAMLAVALPCFALAWESTGARVVRLFASSDTGANVRLWIWDGALRMYAEHPLLGVGPSMFTYFAPRYMGQALAAPGGERYPSNDLWTSGAHSEVLNILAGTGTVGAAIALIIVAYLLTKGHLRRAGIAPLGAMVAFALFNDAWHSLPHAMVTLWWFACVLDGEKTQYVPWHERRSFRQYGDRYIVLVAFPILAMAHAYFFLLPSYRLAKAEDLALSGKNPVHLYETCRDTPFEGQALVDLAAWYTQQQDWHKAKDAAEEAAKLLDYPVVHWLRGLSAFRLGEMDTARAALRDCLFRNPRNQPAFNLLWELSDATGRVELRAHAQRYGLGFPGEAGR